MPFELQRFYDLAGDALRLDYVLESAGNERQLSEVIAAELAARGEAHHQFLQNFAALDFPRDGLQTEVVATELAPGVFHLTGGSHHSLAVEQADGSSSSRLRWMKPAARPSSTGSRRPSPAKPSPTSSPATITSIIPAG